MKKDLSEMKHDLAEVKQQQTRIGRKVTIILDEQTVIQEEFAQIRKDHERYARLLNNSIVRDLDFELKPSWSMPVNHEDEIELARIKTQLEQITSQNNSK
ncbi:hypothetical protein [Metabacillus litoralis]|uniref:hypothetical protein n=1 Tax=Metabacillus litoralis TaxID=152268 RepID=UPI00203ADDF1|nr:hypothetical protein [Metabacillus litoralis]MCM3163766.1 hypothetical protein [Metabacillus litoralis]MCM3409916.1 hypothetical protein [Metabacillus litoralis]